MSYELTTNDSNPWNRFAAQELLRRLKEPPSTGKISIEGTAVRFTLCNGAKTRHEIVRFEDLSEREFTLVLSFADYGTRQDMENARKARRNQPLVCQVLDESLQEIDRFECKKDELPETLEKLGLATASGLLIKVDGTTYYPTELQEALANGKV